MCMRTFSIACMYSLRTCSCIYSMCSVHANTNMCASSTTTDLLMFHELFPCKYPCAYSSSCAQNIVHSTVFLLWQTCSTMRIYTFTVACMYAVHACSCIIQSMFSVHASANISGSSTTTDQCSMTCFHASIHAHTHHHVHRTLYTLIFFFYDKLVVHMCLAQSSPRLEHDWRDIKPGYVHPVKLAKTVAAQIKWSQNSVCNVSPEQPRGKTWT